MNVKFAAVLFCCAASLGACGDKKTETKTTETSVPAAAAKEVASAAPTKPVPQPTAPSIKAADADAKAAPNVADVPPATGVAPEHGGDTSGLDASYIGSYASYPPEQESAAKAPASIELIEQDERQLMGGIYRIIAKVTDAESKTTDLHFKLDPRKEGLRSYVMLKGNGVRLSATIKEVRSGYDMDVTFTEYEGESANELGSYTHRYRKKR